MQESVVGLYNTSLTLLSPYNLIKVILYIGLLIFFTDKTSIRIRFVFVPNTSLTIRIRNEYQKVVFVPSLTFNSQMGIKVTILCYINISFLIYMN